MKRALNADSSPFEGLRRSVRLREKENKVDPLNSTPTLPDDLLFMIFSELSTEERAPLGTTCKRFRELDFELGRKSFDKIHVDWSPYFQHFTLTAPQTCYSIRGPMWNPIPIQRTRHNARLFRRIRTAKMIIKINTSTSTNDYMCNEPQIEQMISFVKDVPCHKLGVYIEANRDGSFNFSFLSQLRDRNWESATILLSLTTNDCATHNVKRTREVLLQLPKMDKFKFEFTPRRPARPDQVKEHVLDDASLLHLASCTNHANLTMVEPTTQGILDVFEVVCRSPIISKYVCFRALKPVADEFFAAMQNTFRIRTTVGGQRCICDAPSRTMLWVASLDGHETVYVTKLDSVGMPMHERVQWYSLFN